MKILGIDYGLSHVGLAITEGILAEPYGQLKTEPLQKLFQQLETIINQEAIEKVVVGISEGGMAQKTAAFVQDLTAALSVPVVTQDETLTSKEASALLVQMKAKKKKRQTRDHEIAACLILQAYLDELV